MRICAPFPLVFVAVFPVFPVFPVVFMLPLVLAEGYCSTLITSNSLITVSGTELPSSWA